MPNGAPLCQVGQRAISQPVRETYPDREVQDGIKSQAAFVMLRPGLGGVFSEEWLVFQLHSANWRLSITCNVWYLVSVCVHVSFCMAYSSFIYSFFLIFFLIWWVWPGYGVVSVNFRGSGARPSWQTVSQVELSAWRIVFGLSGLSDSSAESVCSFMSHGWDSMWRGHGTPAQSAPSWPFKERVTETWGQTLSLYRFHIINTRLFHAPTHTTSSGCFVLHRTVHALWNLYGNPYKNRAEKEEETVTWLGNS